MEFFDKLVNGKELLTSFTESLHHICCTGSQLQKTEKTPPEINGNLAYLFGSVFGPK